MFRVGSCNLSYSFIKLFSKMFLSPRMLVCVRGFVLFLSKQHLVDYQNRLILSVRLTYFNQIEYLKLGKKEGRREERKGGREGGRKGRKGFTFQLTFSELSPGTQRMDEFIMSFKAKEDSLCCFLTRAFQNPCKLLLTMRIALALAR